jgi:hypothetical protein
MSLFKQKNRSVISPKVIALGNQNTVIFSLPYPYREIVVGVNTRCCEHANQIHLLSEMARMAVVALITRQKSTRLFQIVTLLCSPSGG